MNLFRKVAFNTAVQIISKTVTVIFGLLTAIILTGYLGREVFGDYTYVITLVVIFGAFADWGTQIVGVREASKNDSKQDRFLTNIFYTRLVLGFLASFLMILTAAFLPLRTAHPSLLRQAIYLGSIITFLFAVKASFGIVFQTKLEMQKLAIADIAASILIFLLSLFFAYQQAGMMAFIWVVIIANIIALIIAGFLARKTIRFQYSLDFSFIKKLLRESLPMGLILLVFTVDNKIDTVMLGSIKGSGAVGIYGVAYRIYDVMILGAAYLMNALLPILSRYSDLDRWQEKLKAIYQKTFDALLILGAGVMLFTWLFSPLMVSVITQKRFIEFSDSVAVLRLLSFSLFLAYFNHLAGFTAVALGRQRPYLFVALTALLFNAAANLLVIPRYSYFGAAVVTVLTEALILIIASFYLYRLLKIIPSFFHFPKTVLEIIKNRGKIFR